MAKELGFSSVDSFLAQITSSAFVEWQEFNQLEPFGRLVDEVHLVAMRTLISNYLRGKNQPAYKLRDSLTSYLPPEPEKTVTEMYNLLMGKCSE